MRKYKKVDLPMEAWKNFKIKQEKIKSRVYKLTGKVPKLPLTSVITEHSKTPLWLNDEELVKLNKGKKRI